MPDAVALRDALPAADDTEPDRFVKAKACLVRGDDRGLDRPDPVVRRGSDETHQKRSPDAASARGRVDVHRVLDHPAVAVAARHRGHRRPADDRLVRRRDRPENVQVRRVPFLPRGNARLERRDSGGQTGRVDPRDVRPVAGPEVAQHERLHRATVGERAARRTTRTYRSPYAPAVNVLRPTAERLDGALAALQASEIAVYGSSDWTADELREEWEGLDVERDAWLVEVDGRIAGVAHLLEQKGGRYFGDAYVHPELAGRGVGTRLLDSLEGRVRELRPEWPGGARIVLESAHLVGDDRAPALFAGRGFEYARSFFRMVIDVTEPQPDPVWPDGVELRPLEPERDGRMLYDAELEAFADEWDYVVLDYDTWRERAFGPSGFASTLAPVVWAGDDVVAFSRNYAKRNGDWGFVGTLGVRPAWRRRGLGLALLRESFRRFRETGETTAALGVDVENPTGATRLYERAGMRVLWQADVWQKELRAGD